MAEAHIGFLCKAASVFSQSELNESHKILKSYYLMRCKDITRGYGLPKKHFSEKTRCPFCCLEWNNNAETLKLKTLKLSKQQRRRLRSKCKKQNLNNIENLLHCKEMEKTCSYCNRSVKVQVSKPNKHCIKVIEGINDFPEEQHSMQQLKAKKIKQVDNQEVQSNVYCKSNVAFSLKKTKNTLPSSVKVQPKIIKNNKKKKDKFAGLCQKAVIAAAKLKLEKDKDNKLSLFLKPVKPET